MEIPLEALVELSDFSKKLARFPRFHFASAFHIAVMRLLFGLLSRLPTPLGKLGLTGREEEISTRGRKARVRIIEPRSAPLGIVLDVHGGGWCTMRPVQDDPLTGPLAESGFVVLSVDYRHAPEHSVGEMVEDVETALVWALTQGCAIYGVDSVLLHGDSAGAHLAVCAAIQCRSLPESSRLKGQVLFFGAYDLGGTPSATMAPPETLVLHGPTLIDVFVRVSREHELQARRKPSISPIFADLSGLPPSLLFVGTADPLLDDSRLFETRLIAAGVNTKLVEIDGAPHAFNRFPLQIAAIANQYAREWLVAHTV